MSIDVSEKARAFLRETRFAVLATIGKDGSPQLTTMWYLLDEESGVVLMNTRMGRIKDHNIRRDPRIAICIEDGYNYITISGRAEVIDDPHIAQQDIYRLASRYHGEVKARIQMQNQFSREPRATIRLKIERVIEKLE